MDLPESLLIGQDYDEMEGKSYWRVFTEEIEAFNWLMSDYPHHKVWRISTQGTVEMRPSLVPVDDKAVGYCDNCKHAFAHHGDTGCRVQISDGSVCLCCKTGEVNARG